MRKLQRVLARQALVVYVALATPLLALAQSNSVGSVRTLIDRLLALVNPLIALLFGFAVLGFVRGIAVFLWWAENEEKRKESKKFMVWGLVGMFVMTGFWGIIFIIQEFYFGGGAIGSPFKP